MILKLFVNWSYKCVPIYLCIYGIRPSIDFCLKLTHSGTTLTIILPSKISKKIWVLSETDMVECTYNMKQTGMKRDINTTIMVHLYLIYNRKNGGKDAPKSEISAI